MKFNKNIGEKIIVEGIDGAGKSTFIEKYIKEHPDKQYKVVHCTRHTPNNYLFFEDLLTSEENIILDRAMYGQFVYQTKEQRTERHQFEDMLKLALFEYYVMKNVPIQIYYVYCDLDVCLHNCQKDSEDSYYTLDYLKELDMKFRHLFDMSTMDVQFYYNDYHPEETADSKDNKIDYDSFDYSSLPKVVAVDFDGTLVTGAEFPEIGELNQELVNLLYKGKYKDYKKVLFTHRCGDNLVAACNFLADHGIYFDAVNDDVPEIAEILHRNATNNRKIWFDVLFDDKANPENIFK